MHIELDEDGAQAPDEQRHDEDEGDGVDAQFGYFTEIASEKFFPFFRSSKTVPHQGAVVAKRFYTFYNKHNVFVTM